MEAMIPPPSERRPTPGTLLLRLRTAMRTPKYRPSKLQQCALEQERCFLGIASISCSVLSFERPGTRHDDVERLRIAFGAGCSPGKAEHQIPALIDKGDLEATLMQQGMGTEDLRQASKPLELHFPPGYRLLCLQGSHRVAAAGQLNPPVRRWVVKLFDSSMCGCFLFAYHC